ncbi:MAG: hypothetical protein ACRCX2_35785 [Paraclostridium sp.]
MYKNIEIEDMEYEYLDVHTLYEMKKVRAYINTTFRIGDIIGQIKIPTEDVEYMHEYKVKEYIYKHVNSKLERKFVDEI